MASLWMKGYMIRGVCNSRVIWIMSNKSFFFFKPKTAYEVSACLVGSEMFIRDSYFLYLIF